MQYIISEKNYLLTLTTLIPHAIIMNIKSPFLTWIGTVRSQVRPSRFLLWWVQSERFTDDTNTVPTNSSLKKFCPLRVSSHLSGLVERKWDLKLGPGFWLRVSFHNVSSPGLSLHSSTTGETPPRQTPRALSEGEHGIPRAHMCELGVSLVPVLGQCATYLSLSVMSPLLPDSKYSVGLFVIFSFRTLHSPVNRTVISVSFTILAFFVCIPTVPCRDTG